MGTALRANVYVDAFNLYYGAVRGTPYKWLDLAKLSVGLVPRDSINRIRYFTARIHAQGDPQQPQRQQVYIRALETIPNLSVHYGYYLSSVKRMALANPAPGLPATVEVLTSEEKGSDVNLGTYLLTDAMDGDYELAIVVSNDSDLMAPIEVVRKRFGLHVGVFSPHRDHWSRVLASVATFQKGIPRRLLAASLFPDRLSDAHGIIRKPSSW